MRARKRFRKYGSFGGDAAQTVDEQSNKREAFDINELCRAGYIGEGQKNWWVHRNKLSRAGIRPQDWNESAIFLDNQILP